MGTTAPSKEMKKIADDKYWFLTFEIETSTRYHERRRGTYEFLSNWVKVISILGALLAFGAVTDWTKIGINVHFPVEPFVIVGGIIIATINILDLVFGFDARARLHTDLYRRFKELQMNMALKESEKAQHVNEWKAAAQQIRTDEPSTYWAVYAISWNQAVSRFGADKGYVRKIRWYHSFLRNIVHFSPNSFPAMSSA